MTVCVQLESVKVPWNDILRSGSVLSLVFTHFANNCVYYTLLSCLPIYLHFLLRFNIVVVRSRFVCKIKCINRLMADLFDY